MYQPTIDSHLPTRNTHVQLFHGASSVPDAALAMLGSQVLAIGPERSRSFLSRFGAHVAASPTRPTHAPAR